MYPTAIYIENMGKYIYTPPVLKAVSARNIYFKAGICVLGVYVVISYTHAKRKGLLVLTMP